MLHRLYVCFMPGVGTRSAIRRLPAARGFSIVEIIVVVMVMLVIAAIAIPNILQAKMRANETSAIASMNAIHAAEILYSTAYPQTGFAGSLADLGRHGSNCETTSKSNSCLISDDTLTSGIKDGYIFELVADGNMPAENYTLTATPVSVGSSGRCTYTAGPSGQISIATLSSGRFSAGVSNCSL